MVGRCSPGLMFLSHQLLPLLVVRIKRRPCLAGRHVVAAAAGDDLAGSNTAVAGGSRDPGVLILSVLSLGSRKVLLTLLLVGMLVLTLLLQADTVAVVAVAAAVADAAGGCHALLYPCDSANFRQFNALPRRRPFPRRPAHRIYCRHKINFALTLPCGLPHDGVQQSIPAPSGTSHHD